MLTNKLLHATHEEFNRLVFQSRLGRPVFARVVFEAETEGADGLCWGRRIWVRDTPDWKATLLHEMVHQWQHEHGHKLDHGSSFERWRLPCLAHTGLTI